MPSIAKWSAFEFTANDGSTIGSGSLDVPLIIPASSTAQEYCNTLSLAQNATGTLWDAAVGPSDFTYLEILSDTGDAVNGWVMLELTTDEGNVYGIKYATMALLANMPLPLASNASYANYTAGFGGGTLSKIQKIKAKNLNTATATVGIRLVL
jgi:hypothetical protein